MQTFDSESHTAQIDENGLLKVYSKSPKELRETRFTEKGVEVSIHSSDAKGPMHKLLSALQGKPVLAACVNEKGWSIDVECGFCRFNGTSPDKDVRSALRKMGFSKENIKQIAKTCLSEGKLEYCPRY